MNPIVVHKYGGSSLADLDRVRAVARRIADTVADGRRVVAVVSAMGKTTDELLARAKGLAANPNPRELDMLLSTGERVSTALLAIALGELGVLAVSFTGSQSGVITNTRHNRARIIEVRPYRVLDELDAGKVVIIAGYQGVSYAREITTLGRGGTDTTAVAMAAALGAEYCEICSDVDGVYTADPRVVPEARRLDALDHDAMVALARHGSRVLNQDCVEYASRRGVAIFAKSTFGPRDDAGTVVRVNPGHEGSPVTAIAHRVRLGELTLAAGQDAGVLLEEMDRLGVYAETMSGGGDEALRLSFPLDDAHRLEALQTRLGEVFGAAVSTRTDRGSVTVVGHGLGDEPALLRRVLATAREVAQAPCPLHLGPLAAALTVPGPAVEPLVRRLHAELLGGPQ
ncbi:MAG: aspartate kinase [Deltaproteobacteria bacterium]|nr:aspartate kinase [Deltaproteobacteria bacterium]MCB9787396.1 aspartate kinase [Deltaproteobacteria bacterium]